MQIYTHKHPGSSGCSWLTNIQIWPHWQTPAVFQIYKYKHKYIDTNTNTNTYIQTYKSDYTSRHQHSNEIAMHAFEYKKCTVEKKKIFMECLYIYVVVLSW